MSRLGSAAALALLLLVGVAAPARAQSGPPNLRDYLGPFLDLGVGVRSQVLRVHSPDGPYGEFVSTRVLPALTVGSPMLTFGDGRYGLNLIWNTTFFAMDRQTPPDGEWLFGDKKDVGTSIDGYASYLTPTLNVMSNEPNGWVDASRFGIGLGIGHLHAKGDILLNRAEADGDDPAPSSPELRSVDVNDTLPSFAIFMEGRRGPWTLAFSVAGVAQFGSYETDYLDFGLSLSYSFYRALRARPPAAAPTPASAPAPAPVPAPTTP